MATLHVRNVPDDLYERLRKRAAREKRSLSAGVVSLLEAAAGPIVETDDLFERIRRRRVLLERTVGRFPSSVGLLREDRDR